MKIFRRDVKMLGIVVVSESGITILASDIVESGE